MQGSTQASGSGSGRRRQDDGRGGDQHPRGAAALLKDDMARQSAPENSAECDEMSGSRTAQTVTSEWNTRTMDTEMADIDTTNVDTITDTEYQMDEMSLAGPDDSNVSGHDGTVEAEKAKGTVDKGKGKGKAESKGKSKSKGNATTETERKDYASEGREMMEKVLSGGSEFLDACREEFS